MLNRCSARKLDAESYKTNLFFGLIEHPPQPHSELEREITWIIDHNDIKDDLLTGRNLCSVDGYLTNYVEKDG